jgi:hypothetical protein
MEATKQIKMPLGIIRPMEVAPGDKLFTMSHFNEQLMQKTHQHYSYPVFVIKNLIKRFHLF